MVVANSLSALGQSDAAARQYRAVIDLFPDFDDAKAALASELINRGRLDEAEPWMKAVASTGKDPGSALQLALIYANLGLPADAEATLKAIKEPPSAAKIATAARLLMMQDYRKALAYSEDQRSRDRDPIWISAVVISASHTGDLGKAHTALGQVSPELFLPEPKVGDLDTALYAAHALNAVGDRAQARRILDRVLQITGGQTGAYRPNSWRIAAVRAHAELGDNEAALRELRAAVQAGWRTPFRLDDFTWLDRNPNTASLQDDPRFKALMAEVRADLARQRANVLAQRR
jgi:tetratricopeptide (TPR) repeat protein